MQHLHSAVCLTCKNVTKFNILTLIDPSTPNAAEVMKVLLRFEREILAPYSLPGNDLSMNMYDALPLPWDVSPPVPFFPQSEFTRYDYDREGVLTDGKDFFNGTTFTELEDEKTGLSTASMVTRWRAAHPELVGTEKDCVEVFMGELKEAMGGQTWILKGSGTAILLFKKAV